MTDQELMDLAFKARKSSYSPYSGYAVGAALLAGDGRVFLGCNVENASYSPTCCAERTAFFKAISEGVHTFSRIAIVGGKRGEEPESFFTPCGVCRQVMREFAPDLEIICLNGHGEEKTFTLPELLPHSFGPDHLTEKVD